MDIVIVIHPDIPHYENWCGLTDEIQGGHQMLWCQQLCNRFRSAQTSLLQERDHPINETPRAIGEAGCHRKIDSA